ncbi:MAG: hypothetical protein PHQ32_00495 [Firmicutes bacterium]|nr:hypothetical protein [Bacillota bacterium]
MVKKNVLIIISSLFILLLVLISLYYFIFIKNNKISDIPSDKRTETGTIKEITKEGQYGTIFIERDVYKAYVSINKSTIIFSNSSKKILSFQDLKIGDHVMVTVPEIILEIYPYRYPTQKINVLK